MGGARVPISRELRALGAALRAGVPVVVFGIALLVLGLAYQVRPTYRIAVGSRTDAAYWSRMHDGEATPQTREPYRWTQPGSTLTLPGVGPGAYRVRLDLSGARPPGNPPPDLRVRAGDQVLADLQPGPARQVYTVDVPAPVTASGDLRLTLETRNPFEPPGDPRQLGVIVFGVDVVPVGGGLVAPPLATWSGLALAAALLAALLGLAGWGPGVARAGGLAFALGEAGFLLADRLWLTLIPGVLVGVLLGAGGLLLGLGPLWRRLYRAGDIAWPAGDQRWLLAIYGLTFAARLAGQLHPQTVIIDLVFHQHRFEQVLAGNLLFTIRSDEWGGRETFYLPTPYLFMLPLQWLLNDTLLTIRLFTVALDTLGVFLVYYLARRAFGDGRAGLLAAGLQVTLPQAIFPFSWGITANVFGQFVGLAALALIVGIADRLARPGPWLLLTVVLTTTLLSHPGSVQLSALLIGGLLLAWIGAAIREGRRPRAAGRDVPEGQSGIRRLHSKLKAQNSKLKTPYSSLVALAAALVVAGGIAWFGYYTHFAAQQLATLAEIRQARADEAARSGFAIKIGGEVNDWSVGLRRLVVHTRREWLVDGLASFGAEAWAYFHIWPLAWAALGLYAVRRARAPARWRMLGAAVVWAGVVILYALVGWAANLYVRYDLFVLPLVALGSGLLLSALARRGLAARWLVTLIMLAFMLDALAFWYMRITFANK